MTVCTLCTSKCPALAKMISLWPLLNACCKLAPTLARQMWHHNYVIDRNEYLIFTLLESINPWVYSLQFLFKSTNNSWRYERKGEWVFFSERSVDCCMHRLIQAFVQIRIRNKHAYALLILIIFSLQDMLINLYQRTRTNV